VGDGAAGALVAAKTLHLGDPLLNLLADLVTLHPHVTLDHLQRETDVIQRLVHRTVSVVGNHTNRIRKTSLRT